LGVVIAPQQHIASAIAVDDQNIYWINKGGNNTVEKLSKTGTMVMELSPSGPLPLAIAVGPDHVYWTASGGLIQDVPIIGGGTTPIVMDCVDEPKTLTVSSVGLFWATGTQIWQSGLAGENKFTVANTRSGTTSPVVFQSRVYWAENGGMQIVSGPIGGGPVTTISTAPIGTTLVPVGLAVDAANVYWSAQDTTGFGSIFQASRAPNSSSTAIAPNRDRPTAVVVDSVSVYWVEGGGVYKKPLAGGPIITVDSAGHPSSLAIDDSFLYWTDPTQDAVLKAPK
jgi:hypothetical protein